MNPVRFHPKAFAEPEATASYYEGKRSGLGALFSVEARKAQNRIVELPAAARQVRDSIRCRSIHGFPYVLYSSVEEIEIIVIAVAHKRRRPEYWEQRLKAT